MSDLFGNHIVGFPHEAAQIIDTNLLLYDAYMKMMTALKPIRHCV